jgi:hypothetical protein
LNQQRTLADPDGRHDRDAMQAGLDFGNHSLVPGGG